MNRRTFLQGLGGFALWSALAGCASFPLSPLSRTRVFEEPFLKKRLYAASTHGLDMYFRPMRTEESTFHLTVRLGGYDRRFRDSQGQIHTFPDGAAHFLEHIVFKKKEGNVGTEFKKIGAFSNAYTTTDHTNYFFETTEGWTRGLEILLDYVFHREYTPEDVEGERTIILEEWRGRQSDPKGALWNNLGQALYHGPYGDSIIGTPAIITGLSFGLLNAAYDRFYHPVNMFFQGAGNHDPDEVFFEVSRLLDRMGVLPGTKAEPVAVEEPVKIRQAEVVGYAPIKSPLAAFGFKQPYTPQQSTQERFRETITLEILADILFGGTSEIQTNLRRASLLTSPFSGGYSEGRGFGYTGLSAGTLDPPQVEQVVLEGIRKMQRSGVSTKDFRLSQRGIKGEFVRLFSTPGRFLRAFRHYMVNHANVMDYLTLANSITLDEMNRQLQQHFQRDRYAKSVLLPQK